MALNAETENATLNVKLKNVMMMALNAETEKRWWWLWTPKLRSSDGSKRRNWEVMMMALNAKTKNPMIVALSAEIENATLNVKLKTWLWAPRWKSGSVCQAENEQRLLTSDWTCGSEHQTKNNQRLWTSNYEEMVALNAKLKMDDSIRHIQEWMATLNAKRQGNDEGGKYAPM